MPFVKIRWKCLWFVVPPVMVVALVAALLFEPTGNIRAFLRGEAFFQGHPVSYWKEVLREDGQTGQFRILTIEAFRLKLAGVPVLLECLEDSDSNVRWPAVWLLSRSGAPAEVALPAFQQALRDDNAQVRLQAVLALGQLGPKARSVAPDLADLGADPVYQVAFFATKALWKIDAPRAAKAGGWKRFHSPPWGFSAMFPGLPEQKQIPAALDNRIIAHSFLATHHTTNYAIAVSEQPKEVIERSTKEEIFAAGRDLVTLAAEGKVISDQPFEQQGVKGREIVIKVGDNSLRSRSFLVGCRLYHIQVTSNDEFLIREAADYFLNSFRLSR
jgi:hypothetical protein